MRLHRIVIGSLLLVVAACSKEDVPPGSESWSIDHLRKHPPRAEGESVAYQKYIRSMMSGSCYVHRTEMRREWVPFSNDTAAEDMIPEEVRTTLFPFSLHVWYYGGEKIPAGKAEMFICPDCDEALRVWLRYNQKPNQ